MPEGQRGDPAASGAGRNCYSPAIMTRHCTRPWRPAAVFLPLLLAGLLGGCVASGPLDREDEALALPDDPNALVLGAEMALQRGQYRDAAEAYLRAAQLSRDESLTEQAAQVAFEHRQWRIVKQAADAWLELNFTHEQAHRYAAFATLQLYDIDSATEHLSALLETAFINPQAGFLALLPQLGEQASAPAVTAVLRRLVEKYPNLTEAHYALAQAALQSENLALALEHANKARELGPYWSPAGLLLARLHLLNGDAAAGLALAREVVEHDDSDSNRLELGLLQLQGGEEEAGRDALLDLAESETAGAVAERAMANIEFQIGDRDAAVKRFTALVSGGRFVYESLFYLAAAAEGRQNWEEAERYYSRITGGEYAMAAQGRLARIKADREGIEAARTYLQEFAAARPQYRTDVIIAEANLLSGNGDSAGALALLEDALRQYPDAVELRYARIFQLEAAGKVGPMLDDLRELVRERPDDPVAANALGYTLVDRTRHHREGLALIEQALDATPDNGAVLDSMGWALARLRRYDEALEYLERARSNIADPEVELHLGEVMLKLGRKDEAREVWEQALQRYPDNADIQRRLKKLR